MRKIVLSSFLVAVSLATFAQNKLTGFTKDAAEVQRNAEIKFDSYLKASNLDEWMKRLAGRPHHLGSAYGKQNAEFMRDLFRSWGYEAEIETYKVLFPTPSVRLVEMTGPTKFKLKLDEPAL